MFERLKRWFSDKTPAVATLTANAVEHDAFDRADLEEVAGGMGALQKARERLAGTSPIGADLADDLYFSLVRARPQLADPEAVRPTHQPNLHIMSSALDLPEWHRLHAETKGDPWFAGMAATALTPTLVELANGDAVKEQMEQAARLEETMRELSDGQQELDEIEQAIKDLQPKGDEADEAQRQLGDVQDRIAELAAQAQLQAEQLDHAMSMSTFDVSAAMQEAIGAAADRVSDTKEECALWGVDPGQLQRMSADEHMKLAQQLDNQKLRELAKLYGAMKYDVQGARSSKSRYTRDEIYSIEQGSDLSRILPSELVKLKHPLRKREFYRDFVEGRLQCYELRGEEKQAQGGIICAIDTSISMAGMRELWAKATSMHLMDIARDEGRSFTGIVFSGPGAYETHYFKTTDDYTTDRMIAWAECFLNGGTDFQTPLDEALRIANEELLADGSVGSDIVLITDGECSVTPEWFEHYQSEMKRLEISTYGVLIGGYRHQYDLGLEALTDGKISTVADLFTAKDTRGVFAAV